MKIKRIILVFLSAFVLLPSGVARADLLQDLFGLGYSLEDRLRIHGENQRRVEKFYRGLGRAEGRRLRRMLQQLMESRTNPYRIPVDRVKGIDRSPVYLLVQGFDLSGELHWWAPVVDRVVKERRTAFFHKWWKGDSLTGNVRKLVQHIRWLARENRRRKVVVLGFSAGGALGVLAMDALAAGHPSSLPPNVELHSIASPLNGYGGGNRMIRGAFVGLGAGATSGAIARGIWPRVRSVRIPQCTHWVTTDCRLDYNACRDASGWPQMPAAGMPCGNDSTVFLEGLSHMEALNEVFERLLH